MNTIEARDAEVGESTEEEPTEHGDWFAPTDDWEEIWEEFEKKDDVWIGIAVVVLIIGKDSKILLAQQKFFQNVNEKTLLYSILHVLSLKKHFQGYLGWRRIVRSFCSTGVGGKIWYPHST